jgi:UDP-N-acetylglucosamine acyltransferase
MTQIHPSAVIHKNAQLADDVVVGPYCIIHSGVTIGSGTILTAKVVINKDVRIGRNNQIHPNCVLGSQPQVLNLKLDTETGGLVIGDGNIIREQVTIHRAIRPGNLTKVGNNNLLMVSTHIGHDCTVEDNVVMSNLVQISGHCKIETGAWFSGLAASHQFVTIGKWCYIAGLAGINRDIPPFLTVSGHYPPRIRGVNKRGLNRAGLSEQQQERIFDAYKRLYRQEGALLENAKALAMEEQLDENVRAMIDAIIKSNEHQFGRYLEKFRHS